MQCFHTRACCHAMGNHCLQQRSLLQVLLIECTAEKCMLTCSGGYLAHWIKRNWSCSPDIARYLQVLIKLIANFQRPGCLSACCNVIVYIVSCATCGCAQVCQLVACLPLQLSVPKHQLAVETVITSNRPCLPAVTVSYLKLLQTVTAADSSAMHAVQ